MGIKVLKELFARNGQIGYLAHERLDEKIIRPEAVKVLAITQEQGGFTRRKHNPHRTISRGEG